VQRRGRIAVRATPAMPVIWIFEQSGHTDLGLVIPGFHEGLNGAGFVEGRNIAIEYRWAEGDYQRCRPWQTIWSSKRLP